MDYLFRNFTRVSPVFPIIFMLCTNVELRRHVPCVWRNSRTSFVWCCMSGRKYW